MDPFIQILRTQFCIEHNQQITYYAQDSTKGAYCDMCIKKKNGLISFESQLKKLEKIFEGKSKLCVDEIELFEDLQNEIVKWKNNLDKIIQIINVQVNTIKGFKEKLKQSPQYSIYKQQLIIEIQNKGQSIQKECEQVKTSIKQQLLNFNIDELFSKIKVSEIVERQLEPQVEEKRLEYELVKKSLKEKKQCTAFAFNKQIDILIVACEQEIVVYKFKDGEIVYEIQRLAIHKKQVTCIYFMKQSNSFVSGSEDSLIIIWEFGKPDKHSQSQWFSKTLLDEHKKKVYCIRMNRDEDLMISSSIDATIKFWNKINFRWSIQQTIKTDKQVYDISLNENENKLIACVEESVYILEKVNDIKWRIVQIISIETCILSFTFENQFVIQPLKSCKMDIYNYNQDKKKFQKGQEIQINKQEFKYSSFPSQYIQSQNIVTVNYDRYLSIFEIISVDEYQLIQTIEFESDEVYGRLSDDGEFLVTWDDVSKQIQVMKLKKITK